MEKDRWSYATTIQDPRTENARDTSGYKNVRQDQTARDSELEGNNQGFCQLSETSESEVLAVIVLVTMKEENNFRL